MTSVLRARGADEVDDSGRPVDQDGAVTDVEAAPSPPASGPTLSTVVGGIFALWGLLIGIQPIHDNSFLTHLATGRLMLKTGHIPRTDPFSFTAHGTPWTVQSWLPCYVYGLADKLDGLGGVRLVNAAVAALVGVIAWRLSRPARSLIPRLAISGIAAMAGIGIWASRPLLIGLACFGLVLMLVEEGSEVDLRWLVPIMWVWVNSHGSFPLGLGYLLLVAIGTKLDGRDPGRELRAIGWAVGGTLLGALSPLGVRLLVFPFVVLQHSDSFAVIQEWKPPTFDNPWQIIWVGELVLAVALLLRRRSWRAALPLLVFAGLAFTSARNMVPAGLVFIPAMATAAQGLGSITGEGRPRAGRAALASLGVVTLVLTTLALRGPDAGLHAYPEQAVTYLQAHHLLHDRLVAPDYVGNYVEARYRGTVPVFIDDRVDMYPIRVIDEEIVLLHARPTWSQVLDRERAGVVLWRRDKPLTPLLARSPAWRRVYADGDWAVYVRR